jgi:N-acetyl-anhydromuramyl-L-alanine amidase AmpD
MLRLIFTICLLGTWLNAIEIIDRPFAFGDTRTKLTLEYIKEHYGITTESTTIIPRIILIHYTAVETLEGSYARFIEETLPTDRPDIANASALNVSAHFMVDRDGTIYRLMDETTMGRHVIGLNYSSIGIENVGGSKGYDDLTDAQLQANSELATYLSQKYSTITYLVGHHEYRCFEGHPLWLEVDEGYRTKKPDPGAAFMKRLRALQPAFKTPPCGTAHD